MQTAVMTKGIIPAKFTDFQSFWANIREYVRRKTTGRY